MACELTSLGIQVHGGMGFIEETGAAQHFRDARITPIYEGTNGIQAIDLVGRKVPMDGGNVIRRHLASLRQTADRAAVVAGLEQATKHFVAAIDAVGEATDWLLEHGAANPAARLPGAAAYLEMLAVTTGGDVLATGALIDLGDSEMASREALFRFFATNRLARVPGLVAAVRELGGDLEVGRATVLAR
jgi:hypothetical protein